MHCFIIRSALPEMMQELAQEFDLTQIDAVGVSQKPRPVEGSYMPCFLAGVNAATAFAHAKGIPLVLTTHQQGHAAAALFAAKGEQLFVEKVLLFHISGGTTDLLLCDQVTPDRQRWAPAQTFMPDRLWTVWGSGLALASRLVRRSPVWLHSALRRPSSQNPASEGDAMQPFRAGKPVQCPACRRQKPRHMSASTACSVWRIQW